MALDCSKVTTAPKVQVSRVHNKRVQNEADGTWRVPVYAWNRLRPRAKRASRAQCRVRWCAERSDGVQAVENPGLQMRRQRTSWRPKRSAP